MNMRILTIVFGVLILGEILSPGASVMAAARKGSAEALQVAQASPGALTRITQLDTRENAGGESIISIQSTGAIQYTAFKLLNPLRLVLDFPKMEKGSLADQIRVNSSVVDNIRTLYFEEAGVMRLEIVLKKAVDYDIRKPVSDQLEIQLQETASRVAEAPAAATKQEEVPAEVKEPVQKQVTAVADPIDPCANMFANSMERISLDFQGADITNIIRIFTELSGFNLILGADVKGPVNLKLVDVPVAQAFEIILTNASLGKVCLGDNIVRIAYQASLDAETTARLQAQQAKVAAEKAAKLSVDMVTEVRRINHATIVDLAANLTTLKTDQGKVTVDARTNTLVLTDIPSRVKEMVALIDVLDTKTPQVTIESRIVEFNKTLTQKLGIQWGLTGPVNFGTSSGAAGSLKDLTVTSSSGASGVGNFLVNLPTASATSGFGLLLGNVIGGAALDIRLSALESMDIAKVISAPKVTTMDNKKAVISQGDEIPFQSTSADGTTTTFKDAKLSLTVTPHVTPDEAVYMKIVATKDSPSTGTVGTTTAVSISTKSAETEVLVNDGETTVLGGIYTSTITDNESSVPFFSKIPFLGMFFKNTEDVETIRELLIFVTPTVVREN